MFVRHLLQLWVSRWFGLVLPTLVSPIVVRNHRLAWQRNLALGAIALVTIGCAPSKAVQCNQLVEVANTTNDNARLAATGSAEAMTAAASTFEGAAQQLDDLRLADSQLQAFRERLVALYSATSESTRELLTAVEQKDRQLAETALQSLEQAAAEEKPILESIGNYCEVATHDAAESIQ